MEGASARVAKVMNTSPTFDSGEFYIADQQRRRKFQGRDGSGQAIRREKNWKDFIPHNPAVKIDDISFFKDYAVVSEVENGLEYLRVMDMKTRRAPARIETPESVYTMGLSATNPEYDTPVIRYNYSSMITPNSTYEFDLANTNRASFIKQQEIPSGYDKIEVRNDARLGDGPRRRQGADLDRYEKRHKARRQIADAALRVRFVRFFDDAELFDRAA